MVTDALRPKVLPSSVVTAALPAVENVGVPVIEPDVGHDLVAPNPILNEIRDAHHE
jgi:hypothetical protein